MSQDPAPYFAGRSVVTAVIQARAGSTRYPRKVMRPMHGALSAMHVIRERLELCAEVSNIVACIPYTADNDVFAQILHRDGFTVVRGPEFDLVERYKEAWQYGAAAIVRVTADCPLVDPKIVDHLVETWRRDPGLDYVSNVFPRRTYPDGLDVEVLSRDCFDKIDQMSKVGDREAFTTWVWKHPERFRVATMYNAEDLGHVRWTVDTPDDFAGAKVVFSRMPDGFTMDDLLKEFGPVGLPEIGKRL